VRLTTATLARSAEPAGLGGARAVATLALIAPGAEDALGALRAALAGAEGGAGAESGVRAAASGWGGRVVARFMAPDLFLLKRALLPALAALRTGAPLPRVWQT
jgi:Urease accessory protein UreH